MISHVSSVSANAALSHLEKRAKQLMFSGSVLIPTQISRVCVSLCCICTGIGEVERPPALGNRGPLFPAVSLTCFSPSLHVRNSAWPARD